MKNYYVKIGLLVVLSWYILLVVSERVFHVKKSNVFTQ